jgi:hypothetical protein
VMAATLSRSCFGLSDSTLAEILSDKFALDKIFFALRIR